MQSLWWGQQCSLLTWVSYSLREIPILGGWCYWSLPFPQSILFQWHLHLCKTGYSIVLWNMHSDVFKTRWNQRQAGKEKRSQGHCKNVAVCQRKREASEETNLTDTSIWTSNFQNCENISFCYLSQPTCDILLWQPKQTHTRCSKSPVQSDTLVLIMAHAFREWKFQFQPPQSHHTDAQVETDQLGWVALMW